MCCLIFLDWAKSFLVTLIDHIRKILVEKEQRQYDESLTNWLFNEAVDARNIHECGTFRRALSHRIERDLIPIMAVMTSKMDQHHSLSIMNEEPWKQSLWTQLFQCQEILSVTSEDVREFQSQQIIQDQVPFVCWFPFSAVVRNVVHEHLRTYHQEGE